MESSSPQHFHRANCVSPPPGFLSPRLSVSPSDSPRSVDGRPRPSAPVFARADTDPEMELIVNTPDTGDSSEHVQREKTERDLMLEKLDRCGTMPARTRCGDTDGKSPPSPSMACVEKKFTIRNTDTGEEIDLRDENKSDFPQKLARVLKERPKTLQTYWCLLCSKQKREINESLWQAIKDGDVELCRDLLDKDLHGELIAQPNAKGLDNWTSLHLAAHSGNAQICRLLLASSDIEVDARSTIERTPLHVAARVNSPDIVDLLLAHHADINAVDNEGCTPLHIASSLGHIETVKRMLNYDPDFSITNRMEKTCYDLSATPEIRELFETCFEQRGIHINADTYSRTKVGTVFMLNSREDMITKILYKASNRTDPQALRICFERGTFVRPSSPEPVFVGPESTSTGTSSPQGSGCQPSEEEKQTEAVTFREFTPICTLGRGAFGEVYLIRKNDSGELFAMKLLKKDQAVKQNFMRYAVAERNVLTYIRHPFIVALKYAFQTPEKLALVLEYCPGGSLGSVLKKEKKCHLHRFNEDRARMYACEVLLGLEELHAHGIVYRDLKPDNIVLDSEGHALLTDFGLSKEGVFESMVTRSFCGTLAYLPPEMLNRGGHTHTVDFYLFGVLIYEMLIGITPYCANGRNELYYNILHSKLSIPKKFSAAVRDLITRLLDRDPGQRLGAVGGVKEIKSHPWFHGINWDSVMHRELKQIPVPEKTRKVAVPQLTMEKIFSSGGRAGPKVPGWSFIEGSK